MNLSTEELRKLAIPLLILTVLFAAGGGLIWFSEKSLVSSKRELATARAERKASVEKLDRIAEEEREVNEKLAVYRQLEALHVLGSERRLEWADAMTRIRTERDLIDLRYKVQRQKTLGSIPGKPGTIDFFASTMSVNLSLLHEEDLFRFLHDLRASGNAYYSVKQCAISRTGAPADGPTLRARLRTECEIDLITIVDGGAKK